MADGSANTDETARDSDDLLTVIEGGPLEFDLGGKKWQLRQPTPAEVTRIGLWYDIARHRAWQDLEDAEIRQSDIASMVNDAMRTGYLTAKHQASTDEDERRDLAAQIMDLKRSDKTSAWDDIVRAYATAERDRLTLGLLLEGDDRSLLDNAGAVTEARQYVWKVLTLAGTVPNWTGRTA
jgi:hypothetical protein